MARRYGRILTTIWADADFRALPSSAQRMYLFLLSQPNLNHAGLLPLTIRRWANTASGLTLAIIRDDLAALSDAKFIVVDEDAEELLIRTLIRNDSTWKQPKVMLAVQSDASEITSVTLRRTLCTELSRLPDDMPESVRPTVKALVDTLTEGYREGYPEGYREGYPIPTRVRGRAAPTTTTTTSTTTSTCPPTPSNGSGAADVVPSVESENRRAQRLTRKYTDIQKLSNFPAIQGIVKKAIRTGHSDAEIIPALERLAADGRGVTTETLRVELQGLPPPRAKPKSTTNDRVMSGLALAQEYQRREECDTQRQLGS